MRVREVASRQFHKLEIGSASLPPATKIVNIFNVTLWLSGLKQSKRNNSLVSCRYPESPLLLRVIGITGSNPVGVTLKIFN